MNKDFAHAVDRQLAGLTPYEGDMTPEEIAEYRFRVGKTHFKELADAIRYAQSCLYASHVFGLASGKIVWQDGDLFPGRPGAFYQKPYKSPKPDPRDW